MSKLFLGVGRKKITPEIGDPLYGYRSGLFSVAVEDDLTATALYFKQGDTVALAISVTVCAVQNELADYIRSEIEKEFNIPKNNCIISATHNHSCPNTVGSNGWSDFDKKYCDEIFVPRILSAVRTAVDNTSPVKVGISAGPCFVGTNRRELTADNLVILGQNPLGYFNPQMTVITFKNSLNKDVAVIIHYGNHCTASESLIKITRDWAGIMIDAVEEASGAVTAFFNGCLGDIGPRLSNGKTTTDFDGVKDLGIEAAHDAVRIYRRTKEFKEVDLFASTEKVSLPLKKRISYEDALEQLKQYENKAVTFNDIKYHYLKKVLESYERDFVEAETLEIDQTMIKLGDILLLGFPYELFSEIGIRISKESNIPHTLPLSCTNGYNSYFVTEDQLVRGGYEVKRFKYHNTQSLVDNADWHLIKGSLANIKKIK